MYKGLSFRTFSNLKSLNQEKSKYNRQILHPKMIMVKYKNGDGAACKLI